MPPSETVALRQAVRAYDGLIRSLAVRLSSADRAAVDLTMSNIRQYLPQELIGQLAGQSHGDATSLSRGEPQPLPTISRRYLGEASDVSFFNSVKNLLQDNTHHDDGSARVDSYEREDGGPPDWSDGVPPELPNKEVADSFIDVYFSTIHVAYPFMCQQSFIQEYAQFWNAPSAKETQHTWLASLCMYQEAFFVDRS